MAQDSGGAAPERTGGEPADVLAGPPDGRDIAAELAAPARRPLPWLTLTLAACLVAAAGFAAGALVEKHQGHTAQNTGRGNGFSAAGNGAGRTGSGAGRGGTGAGPGAASGGGGGRFGGPGSDMTFGTVKSVDGDTFYVTDPQGGTVKVTTGSSTRVTESKQGSVGDLKPGQSVTVRGQRAANGDITATTVTQGGFGGFGGFGGRGGRSGGGPGGQGGQVTPGGGN